MHPDTTPFQLLILVLFLPIPFQCGLIESIRFASFHAFASGNFLTLPLQCSAKQHRKMASLQAVPAFLWWCCKHTAVEFVLWSPQQVQHACREFPVVRLRYGYQIENIAAGFTTFRNAASNSCRIPNSSASVQQIPQIIAAQYNFSGMFIAFFQDRFPQHSPSPTHTLFHILPDTWTAPTAATPVPPLHSSDVRHPLFLRWKFLQQCPIAH